MSIWIAGMVAACSLMGSKPTESFASRLWSALPEKEGANRLLSPTSIDVCLRMLYFGAGGDTRRTIGRALDLSAEKAEGQTKADLAALRSTPMITVSNAVFAQADAPLKRAYIQKIETIFNGTAETLPESTADAVHHINRWVSDHTKGRIPKLLDQLSRNEATVLVNAITFDGKWVNAFEKSQTKQEPFHGSKGRKVVPMMHRTGRYAAIKSGGHTGVLLPYQGKNYSLLVVLPKPGESPSSALFPVLKEASQAQPAQVDLKLPRFTFTSEYQLKDPLTKIGLGPIFTRGDFGVMSDSVSQVGRVIHKAMIKVNEEGTEAAAATGVVMVRAAIMAPPLTFHADRPFAFAIVDQNLTPLFLGVVNQP